MTYRCGVCFLIERKRRHVCVRCGSTYRRWQLAKCKFNVAVIPPGLGDRMASFVKAAAKLLHIDRFVRETPGCGCWKRREALNKFGRSFWWTKSAK